MDAHKAAHVFDCSTMDKASDFKKKENVILRIYTGFTEVNEKLKIENHKCKLTLSSEQFTQIIKDTLDVDCDQWIYQSVTQKPTNLEGKVVYIRLGRNYTPGLPAALKQGEEAKKAILVRGNDWLVQDPETKRYYHVSRAEMEFEQMPDLDVYDVEFFFDKDCINTETTLRYQLQTMSWKPKYELSVNIDEDYTNSHSLESDFVIKMRCVAVIENKSPVNYLVEKAELFGGQVGIRPPHPVMLRKNVVNQGAMFGIARAASADFPTAEFDSTELGGIYMYELRNSFMMNAKSTAYIEFIRPHVDVNEYSICEVVNPRVSMSRSLERMYELTSDEFLPAGHICIRQGGRIIGSQQLTDLPAKEKREIILGADPAALFERNEKVVVADKTRNVLEIELTLINNHVRRRKFRYREIHHLHRMVVLFEKLDETVFKRIDNGVEILMALDSKTSKTFKFQISKTQQIQQNSK